MLLAQAIDVVRSGAELVGGWAASCAHVLIFGVIFPAGVVSLSVRNDVPLQPRG